MEDAEPGLLQARRQQVRLAGMSARKSAKYGGSDSASAIACWNHQVITIHTEARPGSRYGSVSAASRELPEEEIPEEGIPEARWY
ncbi:hypothetical protein AB0I06_05865 [Streptomyces sp. NPDC050674]|uniref:hypothetical protein n=1 Tax=Streptomyces sp. NPDC050674 TaxID=3157216 RepID=UPI00343CCB94